MVIKFILKLPELIAESVAYQLWHSQLQFRNASKALYKGFIKASMIRNFADLSLGRPITG
jgi:hypothetical protein